MVRAAESAAGFQMPVCTIRRIGRPSNSNVLIAAEVSVPFALPVTSSSRNVNIAARRWASWCSVIALTRDVVAPAETDQRVSPAASEA